MHHVCRTRICVCHCTTIRAAVLPRLCRYKLLFDSGNWMWNRELATVTLGYFISDFLGAVVVCALPTK